MMVGVTLAWMILLLFNQRHQLVVSHLALEEPLDSGRRKLMRMTRSGHSTLNLQIRVLGAEDYSGGNLIQRLMMMTMMTFWMEFLMLLKKKEDSKVQNEQLKNHFRLHHQ